ncbi:MAG: hypothetical protein HRU20_06495 [Pseudomonadales bacterium]|nr:hypothetical protein [Pseudomonadales bacterium]
MKTRLVESHIEINRVKVNSLFPFDGLSDVGMHTAHSSFSLQLRFIRNKVMQAYQALFEEFNGQK